MIEYIKGELTEVTPTLAVVEAAGVGYGINISLNTYTAIQTKKEVKLYIHEAIMTGGRDDSYTLYGFVNKQERELYRMLITVSGVGSNTARMILSATTPTELVNVISSGNEKMLKSVKGIGLRTAQRIIVDLRDKMAASGLIADLQLSAAAAGMPWRSPPAPPRCTSPCVWQGSRSTARAPTARCAGTRSSART